MNDPQTRIAAEAGPLSVAQASVPLSVRDERVIAANQKLRFFPLSIVSGQGAEIVDDTGRHFLDLSAAWGANSLGHAHPRVVAAVRAAAESGGSASVLSAMHPAAVDLGAALLAAVPAPDAAPRRVLFGHSGSDVNSAAIAAVRAASGRAGVLAFRGGYHGGFGAAQAVSGVFVEAGLPADPASALLPFPATAAALPEVWAALDVALAERPVGAIIVEAIQSDGGLVVPPAGFLRELADRAHRAGALLIVDEVKVGLGRTGLLHAFAHDGVVPDLVTFGKALGGGLPLAAVVGPAAVLDAAPASALLTTAGNAISTAAGLAVLRTIIDDRLPEAAAERERELRALLRDAAAAAPEIAEVRGRGLSLGIELRADPAEPSAAADDLFTRRVIFRMWELGVVNYLVRGNVIEWTPPLTLSAAEALRGVETLHTAVTEVRAGAVPIETVAPYLGWEPAHREDEK